MDRDPLSRRRFLAHLGSAAAASLSRPLEAAGNPLHLATNQYPWLTFYGREGRDFAASLDASLGEIASCGIDGYEPLIAGPADIGRLLPLLEKHGLALRSIYVNSTLHTSDAAQESIASILRIAEAAKGAGTRIIVTNPNPIRWGGAEDKDDGMLRAQAKALDALGEKLAARGLVLAYHNHDIELRNAACEFHHMMVATDPKRVKLCLDAHWIYRGSGNSAVAVEDIVELYGHRIAELHLRQSSKHVWTECFGEGDIDYRAIARSLLRIRVVPHLVLEQAVEAATPKTLSAVEAHRRGAAYAREIFAPFAP